MSESPYQSPQPVDPTPGPGGYGTGSDGQGKVKRVASYQKYVIYVLLANIGVTILSMAARSQGPPLAYIGLALGVVIAIAAAVAVFLMANELFNAGVGVLCAILMFVPCVSLITLLVVNQSATSFLQSNGVQVGLMGAKPGTY